MAIVRFKIGNEVWALPLPHTNETLVEFQRRMTALFGKINMRGKMI